MKRFVSITVFVAVGFFATFARASENLARVTLGFTFASGTANIVIANRAALEGVFEHPSNRGALSFAVFDERFNLVAPIGVGKADPPGQKINLKPGEVFNYSINPYIDGQQKLLFSYVSGTAWFGYALEKGKRYRVLAVYRPWGPGSSGVASDEVLIRL